MAIDRRISSIAKFFGQLKTEVVKIIAFMDLEFNSDNDCSNKRNDFSLIEVGMILKKTVSSDNIEGKYHTYVKPILNNGILYDRIIELTGIKQSDIDSGKSFTDVFAEIVKLIDEKQITDIYTSSDYDGFVLRQNCKLYDNVPGKRKLLGRIKNIQQPIERGLRIENASLSALGIICRCNMTHMHNALDDAMLLSMAVKNYSDGSIDNAALKRYKVWVKQRNAYQKLRRMLGNIRQFNDGEKIIELALKGEKFPNFE